MKFDDFLIKIIPNDVLRKKILILVSVILVCILILLLLPTNYYRDDKEVSNEEDFN